jgi:hypothetical protein
VENGGEQVSVSAIPSSFLWDFSCGFGPEKNGGEQVSVSAIPSSFLWDFSWGLVLNRTSQRSENADTQMSVSAIPSRIFPAVLVLNRTSQRSENADTQMSVSAISSSFLWDFSCGFGPESNESTFGKC